MPALGESLYNQGLTYIYEDITYVSVVITKNE